ncbi:hypothetical protein D3C86_1379310 [compost metagenome]
MSFPSVRVVVFFGNQLTNGRVSVSNDGCRSSFRHGNQFVIDYQEPIICSFHIFFHDDSVGYFPGLVCSFLCSFLIPDICGNPSSMVSICRFNYPRKRDLFQRLFQFLLVIDHRSFRNGNSGFPQHVLCKPFTSYGFHCQIICSPQNRCTEQLLITSIPKHIQRVIVQPGNGNISSCCFIQNSLCTWPGHFICPNVFQGFHCSFHIKFFLLCHCPH